MPDVSFEEKMKISREIRESLINADKMMKEEKFQDAAKYYKIAADLSNKLGHTEIANSYMDKAKKLTSVGGDIGPLSPKQSPPVSADNAPFPPKAPETPSASMDPMEDYIRRADKAIQEGNFGDAAKIYEEAARIVPQEAEKLLAEAIALRNKEKDLVVTRKEMLRKTDLLAEYEETLVKIKEALKNDQNQELVKLYGRAAVLAERLGKRDEAGEYRKEAIESKRRVIQEMKNAPKEGRVGLVKQYTEVLKQIKHYLDEKMWQEAANGYLEAANISYELEEYDRAKQFKEKAAKLQEQANILEHATRLKERERELWDEIKSLDRDKNIDNIMQNFDALKKIYDELENEEGLNTLNKERKQFEKIKARKEILEKANLAMAEEDFTKALESFQAALKISMDLGENTKAEGFMKIIEELSGKVDKVTRERQMIEQRSELIASAKNAIKEEPPNIAIAINNYKEAARISFELGEKELANSYLQTAKKIEEDKGLIIERENFLKDAAAALKEKNFVLASKYYEQAAKFSEKLNDGTADKYRKKAQALRDLAEDL